MNEERVWGRISVQDKENKFFLFFFLKKLGWGRDNDAGGRGGVGWFHRRWTSEVEEGRIPEIGRRWCREELHSELAVTPF